MKKDRTMSQMTRREAILTTLFGATGLGLRAFATGIPVSILAHPHRTLAAASASAGCPDPTRAQYLVLSTSSSGDPLNGNVPGTYEDPALVHPPASTMAPKDLTLAGLKTRAAAPWAGLPQAVLDRTSFFHHATHTVVHGDEGQTLRLDGAVNNNEMLVSLLASQLGGCLGTVQTQPICVGAGGNGSELLSYGGRTLPSMPPASLASVLTLPNGPLKDLRSLRDSTLDSLFSWYKKAGNTGQANFIDRYANSQAQLRHVSESLLNNLANITDDSIESQITATVALIQLNVAPVVSIRIDFGGDNHGDNDLSNEASEHVTGVAAIGSLMAKLGSAGLGDRVTFMTLNVFGRTMGIAQNGTRGRDHNANHHCAVLIGKGLKGSIVGGVAKVGSDYGATGIDSTSGKSAPQGGDVPFAETFAAMGKTVGRATGVDQGFLDRNIAQGKTITGALS